MCQERPRPFSRARGAMAPNTASKESQHSTEPPHSQPPPTSLRARHCPAAPGPRLQAGRDTGAGSIGPPLQQRGRGGRGLRHPCWPGRPKHPLLTTSEAGGAATQGHVARAVACLLARRPATKRGIWPASNVSRETLHKRLSQPGHGGRPEETRGQPWLASVGGGWGPLGTQNCPTGPTRPR